MAGRGLEMQTQILGMLQEAKTPKTAYELIAALRGDHPKIAPPTVYRALSALMESGKAHRLESLNAFVACQHTDHNDAAVMSICDDCGLVEESVAPGLTDEIANVAGKSGFAPQRHVIEVHGVCASCGDEGTAQ
ncbi:MAG: Fur family transcriptional regulator [Pseudomonadota bacterium]